MHLYGAGSKPISSHDVELVAAPSDSVDNYCKGHCTASGEYSYTHVWQPASIDVAQYRHANRPTSTQLAPSAAAAARHCCRDHVYESPTFDENGLERPVPLVFPPYYYHAAAAAAVRRPSVGYDSRRAVMQLPIAEMTTADENRHHHHHHQQQQQQHQEAGGQATDENGSAASESGLVVGEWYQPCRTTRNEPVVCRTSSYDPDVTPRPRTDNHYT